MFRSSLLLQLEPAKHKHQQHHTQSVWWVIISIFYFLSSFFLLSFFLAAFFFLSYFFFLSFFLYFYLCFISWMITFFSYSFLWSRTHDQTCCLVQFLLTWLHWDATGLLFLDAVPYFGTRFLKLLGFSLDSTLSSSFASSLRSPF